MHIFIIKNKSVFLNLFSLFDYKGKKMKLSVIILILFFIKSIISPLPSNYLNVTKNGMMLIGFDSLFEYHLSFLASVIIALVFWEDFSNKNYEILYFYNGMKFNKNIFLRFFVYMCIFIFSEFILSIIYVRNIPQNFFSLILLSVRYIPSLLFMCSLSLIMMIYTKNNIASILICTCFYMIDFISNGHFFKIFSLGGCTFNFIYYNSFNYYLINRILLLIISLLFIFYSCKKATQV